MRLAKLGMTLVEPSVLDEGAFSTMTCEDLQRAKLTTRLALCVRMNVQEEYDLVNFPHSVL
jgi:hypothetical protein